MLRRESKALFYLIAGPLMKVNSLIHRHLRPRKKEALRVHLGPGQQNYMQGWVNVDANMFTAKCDIWADLKNALPFDDATVTAIYSHHVIEHLPNLEYHFREAYRCLKPGGIYRVGGPNGDSAIARFVANDHAWFGSFPDNRKSIGGRLENFIFCKQEHLTILTFTFLEELMLKAGFVDISPCLASKETNAPDLFDQCLLLEPESNFIFPHTIIVEGQKPKAHAND
ncbi:MAG: methyltransferase [Chloroflexi bacterium]|nr:MAG: methyltransferase [Chloroflexota bacterium]